MSPAIPRITYGGYPKIRYELDPLRCYSVLQLESGRSHTRINSTFCSHQFPISKYSFKYRRIKTPIYELLTINCYLIRFSLNLTAFLLSPNRMCCAFLSMHSHTFLLKSQNVKEKRICTYIYQNIPPRTRVLPVSYVLRGDDNFFEVHLKAHFPGRG